jgi:glutamyl/glutaminyl-tRNA synthetase
MSRPVRVRFAPSPTGYLHIGGARTALFNWLYARHAGGSFILRIEDTDQARNSQEAVDVILSGLRWLGLDWDEGPETGDANGPSRGGRGPYFQSRRGDIYRARIEQLLSSGHAYRKDGAVFFRMTRDPVTIPDLVTGDVVRPLTDREMADPDWVLVRSDGQPVFHLVNVIDDLEMGVTHVIRGEDHLTNTAKHLELFRAFGAEPPLYAHIPLILNPDGSKMSKRNVGASLQYYMDLGFAPEAVVNYLCLLGWTPKGGRELLSPAEAAAQFELTDIHRGNAKFDLKKLESIHFEKVRSMPVDQYLALAAATGAVAKAGATDAHPPAYTRSALLTVKEKGKLFSELPAWTGFYFSDDASIRPDRETHAKALTPAAAPLLRELAAEFARVTPWTAAGLEAALKALATRLGVKAGALVQPCRAACTGSLVGPSLYHLMEILGSERVARRLASGVVTAETPPPPAPPATAQQPA